MGNFQTAAAWDQSSRTRSQPSSDPGEMGDYAENEDTSHDIEFSDELDLSPAFRHDGIFQLACRMRQSEAKVSIYEDCFTELKEALERLENRTDLTTVGFSQFCDMLSSKNRSNEELLEMFERLDYEGRGAFEVIPVLKSLKKLERISLGDDICDVAKRFETCPWTPGFVDIYINQKDDFKLHVTHILEYLLRNRLPSADLQCDMTAAFGTLTRLRDAIVGSMLESFAAFNVDSKSDTQENDLKTSVMSDDHQLSDIKDNTCDEMSADKVLALWSIQLLTTTAKASLSSNPALLNVALQHSRTSIQRLQPLSLCHDSKQQPSFLTAEYLCEMSSFIELFPERTEVLGLLLSFHLSTGFVFEILQCLTEISASAKIVDCSQLLNKISKVRQQLMKNESHLVKLNLLGSDCEKDAKNDPSSVAETHWKQDAFATKTEQRKATFVFESSEWIEFVKIKIKVANGKCGPKFGLIFVLSEWSCLAEELEKFSLYDKWTKSEFDSLASSLSVWKRWFNREPVASFSTENYDEVDVELSNSVLGKYLVVKFLEPRDPEADHLEIVGVKCFGIQRSSSHALLEKQLNERLQNADAFQSNQLTVQSVLCFLLFVLANQKRKLTKNTYFFSIANHVLVDQRMGLAKFQGASSDNIGLMKAKCPFKAEFSYFEIEIDKSKKSGIVIGAVPVHHASKYFPGLKIDSYGYFAETGTIYGDCRVLIEKPASCQGDKIGCGIKFNGQQIKSIYFTRNGKEIYSQNISFDGNLYPAIGVDDLGAQVRLLNKGPWRYEDVASVEKEHSAKGKEFFSPKYIDLSRVTVEGVWELHKVFSDRVSQSFVLQLLHSMLSWSIPDAIQLKNPDEIFRHLCEIVDLTKENEEDCLAMTARDLIMNGINLFFPSKDDRLKMLFELLNSSNMSGSKLVILQSLCQYFCNFDMDGLMSLPSSPEQDLSSYSFLSTMEKFLSISYQGSSDLLEPVGHDAQAGKSGCYGEQILSGRKKPEHQFYLTRVFNQLQLRLFGWIGLHLQNPGEVDEVEKLLLHYCSHLVGSKVEDLLLRMKTLKDSDVEKILLELDTSILGTTFPELVLLLSKFSANLSSRSKLKLLDVLKTSLSTIHRILMKIPEFSSVNAFDEKKDSVVELSCWEVESPHDQQNIPEFSRVFSCPEAMTFEVEFDSKTQSSYSSDYLEFIDSKGNSRTCSGSFNTPTYPRFLKFENSSYLRFVYSPDSRNSTYGYKFKVFAKKAVLPKFHWLYDLFLSLCRLFGRISGTLLDKSPVFPKSNTSEDKIEAEMYRSELWATIFRAGLVPKKFERSLSGNYETEDQSDVADLVYQLPDLGTEKAKVFMERCKNHKEEQRHDIGGEEINRAVRSVFAALIWHTQSLRHDISIYLRNELDGKISDRIHEAYAASEKLRLVLIAKRQSQRKEEEEAMEADGEEKKPHVDVVSLVEDKARFLLQFSGLSKVASKTEESKKRHESRRVRHLSLSHCLTREVTVDLEIPVETSRHPSFNLVFEFVQDTAWSCEKVEELLKRRYNHCENLWRTYLLVCECLRTISDGHCNMMPCKVFLQELLSTQRKFGRHYADGLDGCGLAMEANVRRSYYDLLRFMVSALRKEENKLKEGGCDIVAAFTLHLLDISWQPFDFPFLAELRLPELYCSLARVFVSPVIKKQPLYGIDETQEEYERNMAWVAQASNDVAAFRREHCENGDTEQIAKFILAKFQKLSYACDGCSNRISRKYYRCLNCNDVDLCLECYKNENIPSSELHCASHELIFFEYVCNGCKGFITGTRWHCKECNFFDLCNGCHKVNNFPSETSHTSDHGVISFNTPKVTQDYQKLIKNPIEFYVYQHSWMLFVALSYGTLDFLSASVPEQKVDDSYLFAARQLLVMCYNQALDYLVSCLNSDVVDSAVLGPSSSSETAKTEAETTSGSSKAVTNSKPLVAKAIGLISSLVSTRKKILDIKEVTENLVSEQFLFTLFDIARAETEVNIQTRLMALGLLDKLLQQMDISSQASESIRSSEDGEMMIVDKKALRIVHSLFDFGADCLEKHNFDLAKAVSELLYSLHRNPTWTKLLSHTFLEIVNFHEKDPTMITVFALFALTGFPEMLTIGTMVKIKIIGKEVTQGIIVKQKEKKMVVVEMNSRQSKEVYCKFLEAVTGELSFLTENQILLFFSFITDAIDHIKKGAEFSAESMWVLALAIKVTLNSISVIGYKQNQKFFEHSFLSCINYLASLGTGLPKALLLQDLEILSLEVNRPTQKPLESTPEATQEPAAVEEEHSDTSSSSEDEMERIASRETGEVVYFMTEDQRREYLRLRSAYQKKKEHIAEEKTDVDKGLANLPNLSDFVSAEIDVEDCIEESCLEKLELMSSSDEKLEQKTTLQKNTSRELMEQLKNASNDGLFPFKVVRALAICYARRLLMTIISEWPKDSEPFTAACLGCDNISSGFFNIHMLSGLEADGMLEKIVERVISYCQPGDVVTIANASSFFIGASEGQVVTLLRQIPCQTGGTVGSAGFSTAVDGKVTFADEVHVPGSETLSIKFEERFSGDCDFELKFSSSSDMSENIHCFTSKSADEWNDFNITGDRLYCVLTLPDVASSPSWKFKVTGILSLPDHFDIGYMALNAIFDKPEVVRLLPVDSIWKQLIFVANSSKSTKRLKTIRLLLKMLALQKKNSGCEAPSVDLSCLRGLWKMYKKLVNDNDREVIKPALVLALTELFFVAENIAQEWNIAENFATSMEKDGHSVTKDEDKSPKVEANIGSVADEE